MSMMTTTETAKLLGVSSEAVRKMLKTGRLEQAGVAGRAILIDTDSVHRAHRDGKRSGRLWTQRTAWAALAILSGAEATWLSASELWRLRQRLAVLSAAEVHQLARNRAVVHRYRGGESVKQKLSQALAVTGAGALEDPVLANAFGLAAGAGMLEGYAKAGFAGMHARKLGLREDPVGDILIRELGFVQPLEGGKVPVAAIAVDLMDSIYIRERSAGRSKLEALLNAI